MKWLISVEREGQPKPRARSAMMSFVAEPITLRSLLPSRFGSTADIVSFGPELSNGGGRRVLSDARGLASDQQLDANVYIVGPGGRGSVSSVR